MKHLGITALMALLLWQLSTPASGQASMYGVTDPCGCCCGPGEVWEIDSETAQMTLVATLPQTLCAIAQQPQTGLLYVVSNQDVNPIYTVDPSDGSFIKLTDGYAIQYHRLTFDSAGNLWGVSGGNNILFSIDPATGVPTRVGSLGVPKGAWWGDMAFENGRLDGFYYGVDQNFYWVDLETLQGTFIRTMPFGVSGMGTLEDGRLFFASDWVLYEVDPVTGAETPVGGFSRSQLLDLSSALPPLFLDVVPDVLNAGDPVTLTARDGTPGALVALALTSLSGTPTFNLLMINSFDGAGQWSLSTTSPALSGISLGLTSFGFTEFGRLQRTNEKAVILQ